MSVRGGAVRGTAAGIVAVLGLGGLAACTKDPLDPARAGTVVVTTDLPFASLNAATAAGRTPGSVLVRGLVQSGFTTLGPDGAVTADASFGTVEKVADDPFTVRYVIAPTATWSDGVPVTPADLLLEWAARSGQLDEVAPAPDEDGEPSDVPQDAVVFGAASPVLARATAVPTVDGASVTVVYDAPVADWQVALDVNLPAHVLGRVALDETATTSDDETGPATSDDATSPASTGDAATPADGATARDDATDAATPGGAQDDTTPDAGSDDATPGSTGTPDPGEASADAEHWAQVVLTAVQEQDRDVLVPLAQAWRDAGRAADVAGDPTLTTTTGPYVLERVGDDGVEAVPNPAYQGARPAAFDRVVVRNDLDPLAQVAALDDDEVDVAAPLSTADVLTAALEVEDAALLTGGDAVLQVVVQEGAGGVFDPAAHASAQDPAAAAAALRRAFLASVPRQEAVTDAVAVLWDEAVPSDVVVAQVGPEAPASPIAATDPSTAAPEDTPGEAASDQDGGAAQEPRTVRVLTNTADPVRAAVLGSMVAAAQEAGFVVEPVEVTDPAGAMRTRPEDWDAALVPVAQESLPVASLVARWRTGGALNVTGHADAELDALLDTLAAEPDPQEVAAQVEVVSDALRDAGAVLPIVRTPVLTLTATRDADDDGGLPVLDAVPPLTPGAADLTWWWDWTRR